MIVLWTAAVAVVFLWWLGESAIPDWDEGTHALVTREMVRSGDWRSLTLLDGDYFRKPPLSFWIRGFLSLPLGVNEWTVRLPSAMAGIGTATVLGLWAWQASRRWLAVHATLIALLTSVFLGLHTFRSGEADGILGFWLVLSLYWFWRSFHRPKFLIWAAAATGLAVMTKSAAGGIPLVVVASAMLWQRRWPYGRREVLAAAAVFLAVVGPWHLFQTAIHGRAFWDEYLGFHVLERLTERITETSELHGPFWYLGIVLRDMFPWALFWPAALTVLWRRRSIDDQWFVPLVVCGVVVPLALYSVAATKLSWYLLPTWLLGCLAFGLAADQLASVRTGLVRWLTAFGLMVSYGLMPLVVPRGEFNALGVDHWRQVALSFSSGTWLGIVLSGAIGLIVWLMRRRRGLSVARIALLHLALIGVLFTWRRVNVVDESVYRLIAERLGQADRVVTYVFDPAIRFNKSARFYLDDRPGRELRFLDGDQSALTAVVSADPTAVVLARQETALDLPGYETIFSRAGLALYRREP